MRYTPFLAELFKKNRAKLYAQLPPKSIVVVSSNDIMPTNADGTMGFRQNSDLFYLSGLDQEETYLILYPDAPEPQWREIAFVRETSELIEIWEGHKYTKEEATQTSGIKKIQWSSNFDSLLKTLVYSANHVYLTDNEHLRNASVVQTQNARLGINIRNTYPNHAIGRLAPILSDLRMQKEPEELQAMQVACDITEKGFRRVLNFTKPGVTEYEIEAEFIHEFTRNRSEGFAYTPIIASGSNACVLHYMENNQQCQDGDVILLDVGAEYANYASDLTRCLPVNGRFTARQKAVYNAVLHVKNEAQKLLVDDWHNEPWGWAKRQGFVK